MSFYEDGYTLFVDVDGQCAQVPTELVEDPDFDHEAVAIRYFQIERDLAAINRGEL